MCPACRALVDRNDKVCPFCQERITLRYGAGLGRLAALVLPEHGRVTALLLMVNSLLYVLTWVATNRDREGELGARLLFGSIDGYTLLRFGAKYGALVALGEWWRLITPIFLHGNLMHLAMNSWVLYDLGPAVESLYGRQRFLVLYILSGAAGVVLSLLWRPNALSVGASGAIFGLIGAMITYGYRNRRTVTDAVRSMYVRYAIYALVLTFVVPGIDIGGHIGGLVAGMGFGLVVSDLPSLTRSSILLWKTLQTAVALLIAVSFIMVALHPLS
jgi:rhomboid protease GluP